VAEKLLIFVLFKAHADEVGSEEKLLPLDNRQSPVAHPSEAHHEP
jgi:hypothetical protein